MGYLLTKMGKPVEAMESYGSGLRVQQKLASDHPELPDFARDVARPSMTWRSSTWKRNDSRKPVSG